MAGEKGEQPNEQQLREERQDTVRIAYIIRTVERAQIRRG